jgi:hypothetical protein
MNLKKIHIPLPAMMMAAAVFMGVQTVPAQGADTKPMLRIICATSVGEGQEIVLATKSEDGKWNELAATELRAPMVSEWLPSQAGEIHIMVKQNGSLESIGHFTHPAGASHALVILTADETAKIYRAYAVDPGKDGFEATNSLIINASKVTGTVSLDTKTVEVEAGRHLVAKPVMDENGGYRLMVQYPDPQGEKQLCYDRQVIANAKSRNIIVLLPDPSVNLRVISLPEFGPFR